jgi:hypothetical protein
VAPRKAVQALIASFVTRNAPEQSLWLASSVTRCPGVRRLRSGGRPADREGNSVTEWSSSKKEKLGVRTSDLACRVGVSDASEAPMNRPGQSRQPTDLRRLDWTG